jgi:hypothetical protein
MLKSLSKNVCSVQEVQPSDCRRCGLVRSGVRWTKTVTSRARYEVMSGKEMGGGEGLRKEEMCRHRVEMLRVYQCPLLLVILLDIL